MHGSPHGRGGKEVNDLDPDLHLVSLQMDRFALRIGFVEVQGKKAFHVSGAPV